MSDSDENDVVIMGPDGKAKRIEDEDDSQSVVIQDPSQTSLIEERATPKPRITIEYERVGSFDVFETICPLEFSGFPTASPAPPPPTTEQQQEQRLARAKRRAAKSKNKKALKTISIVDNLPPTSSDSDEDEHQLNGMNAEPPPVLMPIYLDTFFRSENPSFKEPEAQAQVFWAKGDSAKIPAACPPTAVAEESESDLDPDIARYVETQLEKKYKGENVTGESLWYDQERSIIRNLHPNGSISLTSYGDTDEKIFGKTEVFEQILTPEERAMLRARDTEEAYLKVEKTKKKVNLDGKKFKKHHNQAHHHQTSRPKDQGDWV